MFYFLSSKPIFLYFSVNSSRNDDESKTPVKPREQCRSTSTIPTSSGSIHQQSMINIGLKFAYLNGSLANLEKLSTDMHDQACFKNARAVRHLDELCANYPRYVIGNLTQTVNSDAHLTSLNAWLRSIAEFLVVAHRTKLEWCSCPRRDQHLQQQQQPQQSPQPLTVDCDCLLREVEQNCSLRSSALIRFFLQTPLNGNFFKLKHLYTFLERTQESLTSATDFTASIESLSGDDLARPFENSAKSAFLLAEIVRFLKTPCVYTVFKAALNEKRHQPNANGMVPPSPPIAAAVSPNLIGSQVEQANTSSSSDSNSRKVIVNSNMNNNDENFSNMNITEARTLQLKTLINSTSSVPGPVESEIIRSPLNGNY